MVSEVVIIGGGASIKPNLAVAKSFLSNKLVIACNYAYKYVPHTFLAFMDREFYYPRPEADNPNIYEDLKKESLIVGINGNGIEEFKLDNTILIDRKKFYHGNLTGIWAMSLACHLLDNVGKIYLLGFDWTRQPIPVDKSKYDSKAGGQIHFYDVKHRGTGYTGYYDNHDSDKNFEPFINKKDVTINNVSLDSNINCFPKISYETFYKSLSSEICNQETNRIEIGDKLKVS